MKKIVFYITYSLVFNLTLLIFLFISIQNSNNKINNGQNWMNPFILKTANNAQTNKNKAVRNNHIQTKMNM